jgi:histidine triad (HIT) family protein
VHPLVHPRHNGQDIVSCVFCEIVANRVAASRIFEDEHIIAFMDIRPVRRGQAVIIPRRHIDHFSELPDDLAVHVFLAGQHLARTMRRVLSPLRVGTVVHGFGVPHAHLVVMPLEHPWDITSAAFSLIEDGAVVFRWEQVAHADRDDLDAMAARLREHDAP